MELDLSRPSSPAGPGRRVWLAVGAGLLLVAAALVFPLHARDTLWFVAGSLFAMVPVIAAAVAISASIRASGADGLLARLFEGRQAGSILAASLFGAVTPICGLGVLPIVAGLLAAGVPLAPIMAFWLASPITDPAMLTVTAAILGLPFALGKTLAAFAIGAGGGLATLAITGSGLLREPLRSAPAAVTARKGCCATLALRWAFWAEPARRSLFLREALQAAVPLVKWLSIAFALESLLHGLLPTALVAEALDQGGARAIPLAVAVGIPLYLDGYAALPLVRGLIDLGLAPGAAMAFLVAGGITSLYASLAVFALVRPTVFLCYLVLAILGALAAGYGYTAWVGLAG